MESEYRGYADAAKAHLYIQNAMIELGAEQLAPNPLQIFGDNQPAISATENDTKRSKHIDIKYHFIKELVEEGKIKFQHIPTKELVADGLTKALSNTEYYRFLTQLGMTQSLQAELGGVSEDSAAASV